MFFPNTKVPQSNNHLTFLCRWSFFSMTIVPSLAHGTKLSSHLQPSCSNLPPVPNQRYTGVVGAPETFASLQLSSGQKLTLSFDLLPEWISAHAVSCICSSIL